MHDDSLYRPAEFGMLRTPVLPIRNGLPGLGGNVDEATDNELVAYLRASASDPVLREAIGVSTPSLAQLLDQVVAGVPLRSARLRNAALSVARYVIRAGNRSTPFGVLAGVAPLYFGSSAAVVPGAGHVKHVGLDGAWLAELLRDLESRPEIMRELDLVVDHEAVRKGRGVHFYTDARRSRGSGFPRPGKSCVRTWWSTRSSNSPPARSGRVCCSISSRPPFPIGRGRDWPRWWGSWCAAGCC